MLPFPVFPSADENPRELWSVNAQELCKGVDPARLWLGILCPLVDSRRFRHMVQGTGLTKRRSEPLPVPQLS